MYYINFLMFSFHYLFLVNEKSDINGTSSGGDGIPKIVSHLSSMYVKDGESVTLQCRIIGK